MKIERTGWSVAEAEFGLHMGGANAAAGLRRVRRAMDGFGYTVDR